MERPANIDTSSLSKQERQLLAHLKGAGREWLDLQEDAEVLSSISASPQDLVDRLRHKGVLHTVQRGRYLLNLDASSTAGPRLRRLEPVAELVLGRLNAPYYLSWHSALWHHGLTDQQSRILQVALRGRKRKARFGPWEIRFVTVVERKFFGAESALIDGVSVWIASVEKAIVDAFDRPCLVGGHPAMAARSLDRAWRTGKLNPELLVQTAIDFDSPFLSRRLGFFMDCFGIPGGHELHAYIGESYAVPLAPGWQPGTDVRRDSYWRVLVDDDLVYAAESPR